MNLLRQPDFKDIDWEAIPSPGKLFQRLLLPVRNGFRSYLTADHPSEVIRAFNQFRILCALREGPYGVQMVNQWIEDMLRSEGLIGQGGSNWYHGRPVMITRNDYDMGLFNGDVGITLEDPEDRALRVFFPDEVAGFRKVHPTRIGEHETVYAMTVHKSQGSEFETVLLLLPDRDNPILTRELVYTGITRSRKKVSVWGSEPVFKRAVGKRVTRISGLTKALVIQNPPELPE